MESENCFNCKDFDKCQSLINDVSFLNRNITVPCGITFHFTKGFNIPTTKKDKRRNFKNK